MSNFTSEKELERLNESLREKFNADLTQVTGLGTEGLTQEIMDFLCLHLIDPDDAAVQTIAKQGLTNVTQINSQLYDQFGETLSSVLVFKVRHLYKYFAADIMYEAEALIQKIEDSGDHRARFAIKSKFGLNVDKIKIEYRNQYNGILDNIRNISKNDINRKKIILNNNIKSTDDKVFNRTSDEKIIDDKNSNRSTDMCLSDDNRCNRTSDIIVTDDYRRFSRSLTGSSISSKGLRKSDSVLINGYQAGKRRRRGTKDTVPLLLKRQTNSFRKDTTKLLSIDNDNSLIYTLVVIQREEQWFSIYEVAADTSQLIDRHSLLINVDSDTLDKLITGRPKVRARKVKFAISRDASVADTLNPRLCFNKSGSIPPGGGILKLSTQNSNSIPPGGGILKLSTQNSNSGLDETEKDVFLNINETDKSTIDETVEPVVDETVTPTPSEVPDSNSLQFLESPVRNESF
eukprot:GHVL01014126.1.p1 GENE.GHVL01014126.1~~GHVL01014126.1.p1  ORF type:complete len:460 (+),score=133.13 GHVL01014126.1:985-2364(+)